MLGFADIARLFEQIELRLIASLRRNLSAHRKEEKRLGFQWSAWQAEKLRNLDRFRRQNRQILHGYTDIIDDETRSLMLEQFDEGERLAEEQAGETESVPSSAFFGVNKDKMDSLITDITTLEKTAESAALRMVDDVYRQTLHRVQLEMGTGSMTLEQAVDVAVKDFLDKGINCIQYADGRRVNIADYVRMALRTSATRATLQGQAKRLAELGYDTVATTAYGGCSETCEPWQGRAYIDDVFTPWDGERQLIGGVLHGRSHYCGKWFPLLSEATGSGLFHPNCRHGLTVYIDGRTELPKPIPAAEIKAQREREETQRRMERKIRKLKRFAAGTLDPDSAKAYRRKLREAQKELRLFIEQENAAEGRTVLKRDYGKETSYGAAELTEAEKNAIIKQEKAAKDAERRAKEFSGNWTKASLSETIAKFGLDKQSPVNDKGKIIFSRDDSNITVVYDTNEDYFRIQDKSISQKKRSAYLDIDGNNAQNIIENGKQRGRTKQEFQRDTHFLNSDVKEEDENDE